MYILCVYVCFGGDGCERLCAHTNTFREEDTNAYIYMHKDTKGLDHEMIVLISPFVTYIVNFLIKKKDASSVVFKTLNNELFLLINAVDFMWSLHDSINKYSI